MSQLFGSIADIRTCHSAFGLDSPEIEWPIISNYNIGFVDEVQQLTAQQFGQVASIYLKSDRLCPLFVTGDKWQISGFGEGRPWNCSAWRQARLCRRMAIRKVFRCKDPELGAILNELRVSKPSDETMEKLKQRKAWTPVGQPSVEGIRELLRKHPDTNILAVTRKDVEDMCQLALEALFPKYPPYATIHGDVESYSENYYPDGKRKPNNELKASDFPVYKGMRIYITRTLRRDNDYVNGMAGIILGWNQRFKSVRVETVTGHKLEITPFTDQDLGGIVFYPIRPGYASTILKMAGAELPHVTLYLNKMCVPAAGYTALSRVSSLDRILIGGKITADHFPPARESV